MWEASDLKNYEVKLIHYPLDFKFRAGTSRGVLTQKDSWFLVIKKDNERFALGEISIIEGLNPETGKDIEPKVQESIKLIKEGNKTIDIKKSLVNFPSIKFGFESLWHSLMAKKTLQFFDNDFSLGKKGIKINGLVWMGDIDFMLKQVGEKLEAGYSCLKLKIGALDFEKELAIIHSIRQNYGADKLEIRVDANGAFRPTDALIKLNRLAQYNLHSIEQPIRQGNIMDMRQLCSNSPLDIALDEELIGIKGDKLKFLENIMPHYIILKPSLVGGFQEAEEWIKSAESLNIGWWITSALESNIGLNAIAQWTEEMITKYKKQIDMPQGLGTGLLYSNNIPSPLEIIGEKLWYQSEKNWNFDQLKIK